MGDRPALITFGSPLIKLYGWGFPAYFGPGLLGSLAPGGTARVSDWHNFHYPTDPIGGPTVGEPTDFGFLDPAECYYVYGQALPSAQGHSGYWADPRVWSVINCVAAALDKEGADEQEGAVQAGASGITPQAVQALLEAPAADPAELAQLADQSAGAAAEGTGPADGE